MTTFDFSPLYRSSVGFDRLFNLLDAGTRNSGPSYPPYNIELSAENEYRISMAVAGFSTDELDITSEQNVLKIVGKKSEDADAGEKRFLHRGIAARNFEHRFQLADHVRVVGAKLENGLLHIDLLREIPEAMRPQKIAIEGASHENLIEGEKAA